ncbi:16S rRNA (adenine(1518)-N(6)/adenine(1519)-N(6))-dimethyltransferase RsmA [Flammeovirgaceae bacterium SG7u.111]|nr:16S rRNA (adenine(1518)-N(6)/adenine(1519)-N(6))-dimethyltransferase RsmA [Flammeovirgaceae bacterium SG7u.132]WPO33101.1 16S rRNA (adenine(1518)-N(6)/adenine(1519)-N(6))-dimethyltransferase RsmA [Flammeovirgaceae bacterium SG7u.111]
MKYVKAKKHLGQHFLNDDSVAQNIVESLTYHKGYKKLLEIGPGTGVLTKFLLEKKDIELTLSEIDMESIAYLKTNYQVPDSIFIGDFLKINLEETFDQPVGIIGNFPYNISSQIFFKVLENRDKVPELVGMIQKEVADRIASKPGKKTNGILSILLQAYYDIQVEFNVPPHLFIPPPKVQSAVISLKRNDRQALDCDEKLFKKVVKQGFNNRRKTLRNSLKSLGFPIDETTPFMDLRAEQLSVEDFEILTQHFEKKLG